MRMGGADDHPFANESSQHPVRVDADRQRSDGLRSGHGRRCGNPRGDDRRIECEPPAGQTGSTSTMPTRSRSGSPVWIRLTLSVQIRLTIRAISALVAPSESSRRAISHNESPGRTTYRAPRGSGDSDARAPPASATPVSTPAGAAGARTGPGPLGGGGERVVIGAAGVMVIRPPPTGARGVTCGGRDWWWADRCGLTTDPRWGLGFRPCALDLVAGAGGEGIAAGGAIAAGGLVAAGADGVVAVGAGDVVAVGAGDVVVEGAGGIVAAGAGGVVAAGAGGVVAVGAGDVVAVGAAGVVAVGAAGGEPGGGVLVRPGGAAVPGGGVLVSGGVVLVSGGAACPGFSAAHDGSAQGASGRPQLRSSGEHAASAAT